MSRRAGRRGAAVAAALMLVMMVVSACSSSPHRVSASRLRYDRYNDAPALLVDCALRRGLMKPPTDLPSPPPSAPHGLRPWLQGHRVIITSGYEASLFENWYPGSGMVVAGRSFGDWQLMAANSGKLPAAVCGRGASAYQLQKQVYRIRMFNPWPH